jgi:hypothetical protein
LNTICFYTEISHPRLAFVIKFIRQFNDHSEWIHVTDKHVYESFEGISINYSKNRIKEHECFIYYSGWLVKSVDEYSTVPVRHHGNDFQIFPDGDYGFDVIAAIFYVLTRIEEYQTFEQDIHGRFPGRQSMLYKYNALEIPIVDIWVSRFYQDIESKYKIEIKTKNVKPSWSLSIDIDQFYKYKHKGFYKSTGGFIKALMKGNSKDAFERLCVLAFNRKDPFDSYDQFEKLNIDKEQLLFFILSGGNSSWDKNHPLHLKEVKKIINRLKKIGKIGLHPSYSSAQGSSSVKDEKLNLEKQLDYPIQMSRQHFLKIQFPETYRRLLKSGIKKDFSLGYADVPGFRAGTGRSFYWYDVLAEMETDLILIPFQCMDRTYLDYLKLSAKESEAEIKKLFDVCMNWGGHFQLVWHNSSYDFEDEWRGWNGMLESLIHYFNNRE